MTEFTCDRCGQTFSFDQRHTEIVRRDFEERPKPTKVERFCAECLEAYEAFMGQSLVS